MNEWMDGYYAHTLEKKDGMGLFLGMILFLHSLTKSGKLLLSFTTTTKKG